MPGKYQLIPTLFYTTPPTFILLLQLIVAIVVPGCER